MSDAIEELFEDGRLVRPSHHTPTVVHLVRAIATICGVSDLEISPPVRQMIDLIGPAEHVIFALLDGLGMNVVNRLPPTSFVRKHLKMRLNASCPSTTACALTTVATGGYPNRHAITGWFTHMPDIGMTVTTLPFCERFTKQPLIHRGIAVKDVIGLPPLIPRMTHQPLSVGPADICDTPYNLWSRGGAPGMGYQTIPQAIDRVIEHVLQAAGPTYTHLYLPEIDTICHRLGVTHESVVPLVEDIDAQIERLYHAVGDRARIVVCADHGLIDVPPADQTLLLDGDPLLDLLEVPPSGDARLPIFHVREGGHEAFISLFNERFGDGMLLLRTDHAEAMELFGPGPMSPLARRRFGDYIAVAYRATTLAYHPRDKPIRHLYLGVHAGMSPQEMAIPLVIA